MGRKIEDYSPITEGPREYEGGEGDVLSMYEKFVEDCKDKGKSSEETLISMRKKWVGISDNVFEYVLRHYYK